MYGKEFPTYDDICHHKYVKRERIGDKWRYFYDTKISGKTYKNDYAAYKGTSEYGREVNRMLNSTANNLRAMNKTLNSSNVSNHDFAKDFYDRQNAAYREDMKNARNTIRNNKSAIAQYEVAASKAAKDYYTKSLAGRISKAGMDIKKIINAIKNPPEVKKYKDVKTGISYKEKTYRDENGKVKEVRTTMSGAPITEKQKKAAKERKTKATAQQLANLARIDSIQQKYGDAMRKSYNGQNINDVRKKNTDSSKKKNETEPDELKELNTSYKNAKNELLDSYNKEVTELKKSYNSLSKNEKEYYSTEYHKALNELKSEKDKEMKELDSQYKKYSNEIRQEYKKK